MASGAEVQDGIHQLLAQILGADLVAREWSARGGAEDAFADVMSYAPRLDIAVGPFNCTFKRRFDDAAVILETDHSILRAVCAVVAEQNAHMFENAYPRCLIGTEIEHATSSKHILGGITNVSMLARYGVVVGSDDLIAEVRRIHSYVKKLRGVGKAPPDLFGNVACLSRTEFFASIGA
jgi:hypothetical protein